MNAQQRIVIGRTGEKAAIAYLVKAHYNVLDKNFRIRGGEIDVICKKSDIIVFVEVKSRIGPVGARPWESVTPRKLIHIKRVMYYYLLKHKLGGSKLRVDVISILFRSDMSVRSLKHFKNVCSE